MRYGKKILSILGIIIKWLFLISVLGYIIRIFSEIGVSSFDKIGNDFLSAVVCGLTAFAGYRLERFGKCEKEPAAGKTVTTLNLPRKKEPVAEPVYKPVIDRPGVVSNGEFIYKFRDGVDLFADGKEGLAYPELQWDFQVAANLGKHILDNGGLIRSICIGGGSDEVAHTGTVAYSNGYSSLESFVENCMKDIDRAESDAGMEYAGWFSFLDYKYINIYAKIKETDIKIEYSNMGSSITVSFPLGNGSEGFPYLTDLVSRFGTKDYDQGVGADKIYWDSSLKIFQRTYQLEETGTYFLSSYMNLEGNFTKFSLDVETADDSHYEILPKKMEKLTQILKERMNQEYLRNPAVSCAYYLQHHNGRDLITLLKKYYLIDKEFSQEAGIKVISGGRGIL